MNEIARQLNAALDGTIAGALLSARGRRMYFPRGIVAQSAEANKDAHRLNATAGIATQGGQPLFLSPIKSHIPKLQPGEIFSYSPTAGVPELREMWLREMVKKNPSLEGRKTTLPAVVSGLTHGLTVLADLFVEPGDTVILPDLFWGNYRLILQDRMEARVQTFPFISEAGALNLSALAEVLASVRSGDGGGNAKAILLLNFPNNPTGYSPSQREAAELLGLIGESGKSGIRLLLVCDDAYFGLFYEPGIYSQSIFAEASDLHENVLAVKVDGATKENLVWGFRVGFLTFASPGLGGEDAVFHALNQKVTGVVRATVSNSSTLSQNLLLQAMRSPIYDEEKQRVFAILQERYRRSREILDSLNGPLRVLPFNSGYFLCFDTGDIGAERLRRKLLKEEGIGTISIQDRYLRVAYSSVDVERLEELYATIMTAAADSD
jgi:aspartate/methionine/tyrosine aminotransferase